MGRAIIITILLFVFITIARYIFYLFDLYHITQEKKHFNQVLLVLDKTNFSELIEKTPLIALDLMNSILLELSKFANIKNKDFKSQLNRIRLLNEIDWFYHPFFIGKSKHNKGFYIYNVDSKNKTYYYGGTSGFIFTTQPAWYYDTEEEALAWINRTLFNNKIKPLQEFLHTSEDNVLFDVL